MKDEIQITILSGCVYNGGSKAKPGDVVTVSASEASLLCGSGKASREVAAAKPKSKKQPKVKKPAEKPADE